MKVSIEAFIATKSYVNSLCCLVLNYHYRSLLTNLWYFKTNRCPHEPVPLLQGVDN